MFKRLWSIRFLEIKCLKRRLESVYALPDLFAMYCSKDSFGCCWICMMKFTQNKKVSRNYPFRCNFGIFKIVRFVTIKMAIVLKYFCYFWKISMSFLVHCFMWYFYIFSYLFPMMIIITKGLSISSCLLYK